MCDPKPPFPLPLARAVAALGPLGVSTVGDLANWKYAAWAEAMTTLSKYENPDDSSR